jgi:predicted DNA-binding transcriptional regulator YafY
LSLLLLLQNRGRMTGPALAAELEVSVRTVYRDVESLSAAGVPVYADRGPSGGYRLLDGYRTRLTGLTSDEAESLFLAGMPGPAAELGLGGALAAAQLKLTAALPAELRDRVGRVSERFHLDAPGWFRDAEDTPFLADIASALWRDRRIAVRYRRWGNEIVERELDPLGLVLKAGVWYLVARRADPGTWPADRRNHESADEAGGRPGAESGAEPGAERGEMAHLAGGPVGAPRTYRVSRVLALRVGQERAARPADFDLAEFWGTRSAQLRAALWRDQATVRLSPRGRALVPAVCGSVEARAVAESAGAPSEDGWVEATLPIESTRHAESMLLRLGAEVEVLAPAELRAQLAITARALTALYATVYRARSLPPSPCRRPRAAAPG